MRKNKRFQEFEDTPIPIIIIDEELKGIFSNSAAKKAFTSLCGPNGILNYVDDAPSIKKSVKAGVMSQIRSDKPNGYCLLCVFPFIYMKEKYALVLAENSFNLYKATDGFDKEMIESYAFQQMIQSNISCIDTVTDALKKRLDNIKELEVYFDKISEHTEKLHRLSESIIAAQRIQRLFSEFNVETIDVKRTLWDIDKSKHIFILDGLDELDGKIMYNKTEFISIINDISDYLLCNSDGSEIISVKSSLTDANVILEFSIAANGKNLPETEWTADPRRGFRNGLSFAEKIAESRGGSLKARKRGSAIQVLFTVRKLLPTDYAGYIAKPNISNINQ